MLNEIPQTCVDEETGPQQRRRIAAQQLPVATTRKPICYVYIEQCSNVYTAKTEKIYEKTHKPHRTRTCEAACLYDLTDICSLRSTGPQWRTHVRSVWSGGPQSLVVQTCSFARACSLRCMRFLVYFFRFRCVNVTTLFNIDVTNTFSSRRDGQLLCCYSVPLLWTCLVFNACLRYFRLHFFV